MFKSVDMMTLDDLRQYSGRFRLGKRIAAQQSRTGVGDLVTPPGNDLTLVRLKKRLAVKLC